MSTLQDRRSPPALAAFRAFLHHPRGVAPEPLETVELARLTREDVHDQVRVVDQDPLAEAVSLDVARMHPLLPEPVDDGIADRLRLPPLVPSKNDEAIGERSDALQVQRKGILRNLLRRRLEHEPDRLFQLDESLLQLKKTIRLVLEAAAEKLAENPVA